MTVVTNMQAPNSYTAKDMLWSEKGAINAMVRDIIEGQAETWIEMSLDDPDGLTKSYVEKQLKDNLRNNAKQVIADLMDELVAAMHKEIDTVQFSAHVTSINYTVPMGEVDDVKVKLFFE